MTSKTMWTIVATITIAFVILVTSTSANETKTINNKVNQFIVEEKNEIVEYQKENWQKGKEQIAQNNILIYMKGTPYEPRCGFSAKTVQALIDCEAEFSCVDILANSEIRATLPSVSDWPTFPQVFVAGELIGGADIVTELNESGELSKIIQAAAK